MLTRRASRMRWRCSASSSGNPYTQSAATRCAVLASRNRPPGASSTACRAASSGKHSTTTSACCINSRRRESSLRHSSSIRSTARSPRRASRAAISRPVVPACPSMKTLCATEGSAAEEELHGAIVANAAQRPCPYASRVESFGAFQRVPRRGRACPVPSRIGRCVPSRRESVGGFDTGDHKGRPCTLPTGPCRTRRPSGNSPRRFRAIAPRVRRWLWRLRP